MLQYNQVSNICVTAVSPLLADVSVVASSQDAVAAAWSSLRPASPSERGLQDFWEKIGEFSWKNLMESSRLWMILASIKAGP